MQVKEIIVHYTIHAYIDLLSNESTGVVVIIEDSNLSDNKLLDPQMQVRKRKKAKNYTVAHDFDYEGYSFETNLHSAISKLENILKGS